MKIQTLDSTDRYTDDEHIINVAESFNCPEQDKEYNDEYKKWRSNTKNPYAFQFIADTRENAYIDGVGFIEANPKKNEKNALTKFSFLLGALLVLYYVIETFGEGLLCRIYNLFGGNTQWSIVYGLIDAPSLIVLLDKIIIGTVKWAVPAVLLTVFLKLPSKVAFPAKISNRAMHKLTIPCAMIFISLIQVLNNYFINILEYFKIDIVPKQFFRPEANLAWVVLIVFEIVLIPVISELFLRGILLQSLRQYGDGFAILISSAVSSALVHDITRSCAVFILSLFIGFFVLKTGSLKSGIFIQIIYKAFVYIQLFLWSYLPKDNFEPINYITQFVLILAGTVIFVLVSRKDYDCLYFEFRQTYMTMKEKTACLFTANTVILWLIYTFVLTVAALQFKG